METAVALCFGVELGVAAPPAACRRQLKTEAGAKTN
jgi:hypothetical protein